MYTASFTYIATVIYNRSLYRIFLWWFLCLGFRKGPPPYMANL